MGHRARKTFIVTTLAALAISIFPLTVSAAAPPVYNMSDLGVLPTGYRSGAYGVTAAGGVVGQANVFTGSSYEYHGFLWNGQMQALGLLPGSLQTTATAINSRGPIIGEAAFSPETEHALIWQP